MLDQLSGIRWRQFNRLEFSADRNRDTAPRDYYLEQDIFFKSGTLEETLFASKSEYDSVISLLGLSQLKLLNFLTLNNLSGGQKQRLATARMIFSKPNLLFMDEPTNHLDLESIQALNNGMRDFKGTMIFSSHDHTINQTVANRIIEVFPRGVMDKMVEFDEYIADKKITEQRTKMAAK